MIPFILAAVGGYLIGDSMKSKKFADGGGVGNIKSYRYNFDNYIKIEGTNYSGKLKLGYAVRNVGGRTETYPYLAEIQWDDNNVPNNSDEIETFVYKNLDNLLNAPSMAKGGMTEHGLKSGDKIIDTVYFDENTISVMNDGKYAAVDLDKGERIEGIYADGGGITIYGNNAELPLSNHQMKNYVIDKTGISSGTYINGKYYDSWDKIATDLGFIKDENGWVKAFPSRIYTKKMARGGESHSDQMIDVMNSDREQEMGRRMKFQESTLQEDMEEAREIFGKYWDTLTEKEKIEATKYLKIKGEVGHFGREDEDVQTFMNDLNYKRGGRTNE